MIGDVVLRGMSSILKNSLRRNDIVARYGGEEFAMLISHETVEQAKLIAEKIRSNIASMRLPDAPMVTVSIGCAVYTPDESSDDFFKRSDKALYMAKRSGKNRVCMQ